MGSIIHPFGGMAFLLLFPICSTLGWTQPGVIMLPLVMAMLAAYLGSILELRFRIRQNRLLEAAAHWSSCEDEAAGTFPSGNTPEKLVCLCIAGRALQHALLYAAIYTVMAGVISWLLAIGLYPRLPALSWTFVYVAALVGAVLSLREHRAYLVLGMAFCVMALLLCL